jgi:hypothetical protein
MYLEIAPTGGKYWRLKYRFLDREKRLAIGVYPDVTLAHARRKRDEARAMLADGVDPGQAKKEEKRLARLNAAATFPDGRANSPTCGHLKIPHLETRGA